MANQVTNIGGMLSAVTTTFAYTNASAVTIATIPAGAQIVDINIDVTTAFNAGTTNTVTVGKTGTAAAFVAATSVGSAGRASVATTGVYSAWANTGSSVCPCAVDTSCSNRCATCGSHRSGSHIGGGRS